MSAPSVTMPEADTRWSLPARGPAGMYCLIAAEAAIFTIFVVAYIFYIGKSVSGPQPHDVLRVPVFLTICLLSSSLTIHFAVKLLSKGRVISFALWWLLTVALGAVFPRGHGSRMAPSDSRRRLDHPNQLVRDYILLTGWPTCISRNGRPSCSCDGVDLHAPWECKTGAHRTCRGFVEVLALRGCGSGGCIHRRIYSRPLRKEEHGYRISEPEWR
jgi:hypothetical protein